jgi:hypothetical protein
VLQRAMKLKQKKNLEHVKGNPFDSLQFEKLNQIAKDIHINFGKDSDENKFIISNLIEEEQQCFNTFAEENPEVLLPNNIDFETDSIDIPVNGSELEDKVMTPDDSVKEPESSPSWTKVVRKGETRSRSNKVCYDDRHILEY